MFIQPWDAALEPAEWQEWLSGTDRFGILVVNDLDQAHAPLVVPTHFTVAGDELLLHLARPGPVWPHLQAAGEVRLAVTGDDAYIPTYWRARPADPTRTACPPATTPACSSSAARVRQEGAPLVLAVAPGAS